MLINSFGVPGESLRLVCKTGMSKRKHTGRKHIFVDVNLWLRRGSGWRRVEWGRACKSMEGQFKRNVTLAHNNDDTLYDLLDKFRMGAKGTKLLLKIY